MKKRAPKLTGEHRFTIRCALRRQYDEAMQSLDLQEGHLAGHFLREAAEAWDAYRAFDGRPMHDAVPFGSAYGVLSADRSLMGVAS